MVGNQSYINHKVARNIKSPIHDVKIIEIINDEYWKEWKRLINESVHPCIKVTHLGRWRVEHRRLRRYIRGLIQSIRTIRKSKYRMGDLASFISHDTTVKRFKTAWKQLDAIRIVLIKRGINKYAK